MSFSPDSRILQVKITTEEANLRSRTIAGGGFTCSRRREMKEDELVDRRCNTASGPPVEPISGIRESAVDVLSRTEIACISLQCGHLTLSVCCHLPSIRTCCATPAASSWANDGHDTRSLQHYLSHKNIQHTVRYTELSHDRFKDFWR
jgi:hypothetical protein